MKYWIQTKDTSVMPNDIYQFADTIDTKFGISKYTVIKPPISGTKYDVLKKKFVALSMTDLTAAYKKLTTDPSKWKNMSWWVEYEHPLDDGLPPWPGPLF